MLPCNMLLIGLQHESTAAMSDVSQSGLPDDGFRPQTRLGCTDALCETFQRMLLTPYLRYTCFHGRGPEQQTLSSEA